jgi:UDP-glucose 4-epimerase
MAVNMVLVTGGAGYIGSHTCVALAEANYTPLILDNLINSHKETLIQLENLIDKPPLFIEGDIRDEALLCQLFNEYPIKAVIHFAALKAVGESVAQPLMYYENNVQGTLTLLKVMQKAQVKTLVYSSSATVYGETSAIPYKEDYPRMPINPYGRSKMMVENILADIHHSDSDWKIACLRYFNPVGAHLSGLIGENPRQNPTNLMPIITQVAAGIRQNLLIFGNDYPTIDGTCVRDYIHVMDVAEGHISALNYLAKNKGILNVNLGCGKGISVLEIIKSFEKSTGCQIAYKFSQKRPGDLPAYWADTHLAEKILGWKARRNLDQICEDAWRWQNTAILYGT